MAQDNWDMVNSKENCLNKKITTHGLQAYGDDPVIKHL